MHKKLIVMHNDKQLQEYILNEGTSDVGRRQDCAMTIDDAAASGRHANFISVLDDVFVEDCGSSNGTFVNVASNKGKITRERLQHNDVVTIGTHTITYIDDVGAMIDPEFCKTAVYLPGSPAAAAGIVKIAEQTVNPDDKVLSAPEQGWGNAAEGRLTLIGKIANGKILRLCRTVVALGRPEQQLAAISRWEDGYYLSHIGSDRDGKRYPLLNSEPVPNSAKLNNNDKINLIGLELLFNI